MNPACEICRGACCEGIRMPGPFNDPDLNRWFFLHGKVEDGRVYLACPCSALVDGRCSIYEDRPQVCRKFAVGSNGCRYAIKRNRPGNASEILRAIEQQAA